MYMILFVYICLLIYVCRQKCACKLIRAQISVYTYVCAYKNKNVFLDIAMYMYV
jgi:hypothetical protein